MFFSDNPVMQRELLVHLRLTRSFAALLLFIVSVSAMIIMFWPRTGVADLLDTRQAEKLFDLFIIGQFVMLALLAPTVASGAFTNEKEKKTYEMLLASPLKPSAIVVGKLLSSLLFLSLLIFSTLPLILLCLPLGGVNIYEVLAAYFVLTISAASFGMICMFCSSYFARTSSALLVSYLVLLPIASMGALLWYQLGGQFAELRLILCLTLFPIVLCTVSGILFLNVSNRLLYPPDVGSGGEEVYDEDEEQKSAVGLVINRNQFPDNLFAPRRRVDFLPDDSNPVFDKEMSSEIFSQGTLMLRLVIQISMILAIPMMGLFLFFTPSNYAYYVGFVILFNMLIGPAFAASTITSERERQTLELLLTTILQPYQIVSAKLFAGLRVSTVLTLFLVPHIIFAGVIVEELRNNFLALILSLLIIGVTCLSTNNIGMFFSILCRRSSMSLIITYLTIGTLFLLPVTVNYFIDLAELPKLLPFVQNLTNMPSPFAVVGGIPELGKPLVSGGPSANIVDQIASVMPFFFFYTALNVIIIGISLWLFQLRWRVAQ